METDYKSKENGGGGRERREEGREAGGGGISKKAGIGRKGWSQNGQDRNIFMEGGRRREETEGKRDAGE